MDPNAALASILEHLKDGNREEAVWALQNLTDWIECDGFMPTNIQECGGGLLVTKGD